MNKDWQDLGIVQHEIDRSLAYYATKEDFAEIKGELRALRWILGVGGSVLVGLILGLRFA